MFQIEGETQRVDISGPGVFDSGQSIVRMVLNGDGVAQFQRFMVCNQLKPGALEEAWPSSGHQPRQFSLCIWIAGFYLHESEFSLIF